MAPMAKAVSLVFVVLMPSDRHARDSLNKRLKADLVSFKRLIEHDPGFAQMSGTAMTGASGIGMTGGTILRGGMGRRDDGTGHGEMPTPGIGNAGGDYNSPANVAARIAKARSTATGGAHMLDEHDSF